MTILTLSLLTMPAKCVTIDFRKCHPETKTLSGPQGSTTYEIVGKKDDTCLFCWGSEVEDPRWKWGGVW